MQESFDFAADDLAFIRTALTNMFGRLAPFERTEPIWRLARSLIGCRTYDVVAEPALRRLKRRWRHPSKLAVAPIAEVERVIANVTYAEDKARNLVSAMQWIGRERPDYDLSFLQHRPVHQALAWLERLPGVGPKVAAATLNASSLRMRVFIVDSHVHRVLVRFGFIGRNATAEDGRNAVTAAASSFDADDLLELFAQMKRLGQTFCRAGTRNCWACPLQARCSKID
jgi:endonuclease-3